MDNTEEKYKKFLGKDYHSEIYFVPIQSPQFDEIIKHCLFITDIFYYICIFNICIFNNVNNGFKYYALHSLW